MTRRLMLLGDSLLLGGTEGQFTEIACGLRRTTWDVEVACLRATGPLLAKFEAAGIRPRSFGPGSLKSSRAIASVLRLARHLRRTRVVVLHCFDFYSNSLGVLAGRLARVPVVLASQRDLGNLRPPIQRTFGHVMLRLADHVLVNAVAVGARVLEARAATPERIVVIPNGVDVTRFFPKPITPASTGSPLTVGTLSNLRGEKGIADIVQAAALVREHHPHLRFQIFGSGPLRTDLEQQIRTRHLERWVELYPSTTDPSSALRGMDMFVLASHSEACSNALLEAMATRLAIVATDVGGNPELITDEHSGLLTPPADPAGLAKAIIRLAEEPALAARLAREAHRRAHSLFSLSSMLHKLEAFYEQALAGARR